MANDIMAAKDPESLPAVLSRRTRTDASTSSSNSSRQGQGDVDLFSIYLRHCAQDDADAASLLRSYLYLLPKRTGSRFRDLVWSTTSSPLSGLDLNDSNTYSQSFLELQAELTFQRYAPFQLCAVAETCDAPKKPFSFAQNLSALFQDRTRELEKTIQILAIWTVCLKWAIKNDVRAEMLSTLQPYDMQIPIWEGKLPSEGSPRELAMDLFSGRRESLTLEWIRKAPRYVSDLNVSMWLPHHKSPPIEHLRVVFLPHHGSDGVQIVQAFAVVKSPQSLRNLRQTYEESLSSTQAPGQTLSVQEATTVFLASIMSGIRTDLKTFLIGARMQLRSLAMEGRRNPSPSKVQFLCHLEDSQTLAQRCCLELAQKATMLAASCQNPGPTKPSSISQPHIDSLYDVEADLRYLADEIGRNQGSIVPLKQMIHEQLDLQSRWRTTIVQLLVALYVPMSFMTSFLGMNISTTNPMSQTNYTASALGGAAGSDASGAPSGVAFLNGLSVNSISNAESGTTWPMWLFWAAGVPLTIVTIVVPLVAGMAFRFVFQSVHRYYQWWRVVILFLYPPVVWIVFACKGGATSVLTLVLAGVFGYLPLIILVIWNMHRLVQLSKTPASERLVTQGRIWLAFAGWLFFLVISSCIIAVDFAAAHPILYFTYGDRYTRYVAGEDSYASIPLVTGYDMGEILRHPDWFGMLPWIFLALLYAGRAFWGWSKAWRRRRMEKRRRHIRSSSGH